MNNWIKPMGSHDSFDDWGCVALLSFLIIHFSKNISGNWNWLSSHPHPHMHLHDLFCLFPFIQPALTLSKGLRNVFTLDLIKLQFWFLPSPPRFIRGLPFWSGQWSKIGFNGVIVVAWTSHPWFCLYIHPSIHIHSLNSWDDGSDVPD